MRLYEVDPLTDTRWTDLVEQHAAASLFHSPLWLKALQRTYGYEPVVFTDAPPGGHLTNGLLFCRVRSWMTGRRLVSLPFSDHCEPLLERSDVLSSMLSVIKAFVGREGRYIEMRPISPIPSSTGFSSSEQYCLHSIDLRPNEESIFARFHRNHTQRAIRKAITLGVTVEAGRTTALLSAFSALHTLTRRRHAMPVQPLAWFQNLLHSLDDSGSIWLARYKGVPIASILTATHKRTIVYKYGCSDPEYRRYGGTQFVFWTAIQAAKRQQLEHFDLGRSDLDNPGLLAFKDHLGGTRRELTYYRSCPRSMTTASSWRSTAKIAYSLIPRPVQTRVSEHLYRHFA